MMKLARLVVLILLAFGTAHAVEPQEMLKDPKLEARARIISHELRCLVCQNETIDDSDADLARDIRRLVRVRLVRGDTNEQVIAYVRSRYGDFVLERPPFKSSTALLWATPLVGLFIGVWLIRLRRRSQEVKITLLSEQEEARLERLLSRPK